MVNHEGRGMNWKGLGRWRASEAGNFLFLGLGAGHIVVFTMKISGALHL